MPHRGFLPGIDVRQVAQGQGGQKVILVLWQERVRLQPVLYVQIQHVVRERPAQRQEAAQLRDRVVSHQQCLGADVERRPRHSLQLVLPQPDLAAGVQLPSHHANRDGT